MAPSFYKLGNIGALRVDSHEIHLLNEKVVDPGSDDDEPRYLVDSSEDVDSEQMILITRSGTMNAENEATVIAFYTN